MNRRAENHNSIPSFNSTPNSEEKEKPNYYAVLTAEVRYCKKLIPAAKLLYAEITALCNKEGYCWASNDYFSSLYETNPRTIQRWLESLKKEGFIELEMQTTHSGSSRKIYIIETFKRISKGRQKCHPPTAKMSPPHGKNAVHNTKYNTKEEYITPDEDIGLVSFFYDHLKKSILKFPNKSPAQLQKWAHDMSLMRRIDNRSVDEIKKCIEYLETDEFWRNTIHSVTSLRKNFHKLYTKLMKPSPEVQKAKDDNKKVDNIKQNKQIAEKMIKENTSIDDLMCKINDTGVQIKIGKAFTTLGFNVNGFEDQLKSNLSKAIYEKSRNTSV